MTMNRMYKETIMTLCLGCLAFASTQVLAYGDLSLSVGGRIMTSGWQGQNKASGQKFNSDGSTLAGFNLMLQKGRFYTGLNIQGGNYQFKGEAPDKMDATGRTASSGVIINRSELDLTAGYYLWPRFSFFLDIKGITNKWNNENYKLGAVGVGAGVTDFIPFNTTWISYGTFGIVPLNLTANGKDVGNGTGSALEIGGLYNFNPHNRLNFGIKLQNQQFKFSSGENQSHQVNSLFLGYNHIFMF